MPLRSPDLTPGPFYNSKSLRLICPEHKTQYQGCCMPLHSPDLTPEPFENRKPLFFNYAKKINAELIKNGVRSEVDFKNEKIGYKIREAEMMKIPYMFIVGQKEMESGSVSVRRHGEGDLGSFLINEFIEKILSEVKERK